jgi:ABC-type molybdate transport system permease subunit
LHFLALILVAFVLGFLIVLLWSRSGALSASGTELAPVAALHTSLGLVADPA